MAVIDFSKVPESVWVDLCVMAIKGTAEAMKTPEGRAAIEKGREKYLLHLTQKAVVSEQAEIRKEKYGQACTKNVCG